MSCTICETGGGNDGDGNELGYSVEVEETVSDEYKSEGIPGYIVLKRRPEGQTGRTCLWKDWQSGSRRGKRGRSGKRARGCRQVAEGL
jgi:hypothetical protein